MSDVAATRAFLGSAVAVQVAPGSGATAAVQVVSAFVGPAGRPCRTVEESVVIDQQRVRARGTLCQEANGSWALVPGVAVSGR